MDKTELMKDVLKVTGIAPIIAYAEPEQAVPAAKALVAGGLPVVEVLMRNEHAMGNLERIARDVPEIVAGAGTIITLDQAKAAIDHGAQFIIMPGIGRQVVEYCIDRKIPVIPNCITPGEMTMAVEYGLDMVKFFPIYINKSITFSVSLMGTDHINGFPWAISQHLYTICNRQAHLM